jgi:hypothetical protein
MLKSSMFLSYIVVFIEEKGEWEWGEAAKGDKRIIFSGNLFTDFFVFTLL